ncbi:hypothetical protein OKW34_000099 [Paraburkholderia youngii]
MQHKYVVKVPCGAGLATSRFHSECDESRAFSGTFLGFFFSSASCYSQTAQTSKGVARETFLTKRKCIVSDQPIPQDVSDSIGLALTNVDGLAPQEISETVYYIGMQCHSDALPSPSTDQAAWRHIPSASKLCRNRIPVCQGSSAQRDGEDVDRNRACCLAPPHRASFFGVRYGI